MERKTIADIDLAGRTVFLRADFNVPLDANGTITDDIRITAALPTIRHILDAGAALIIASHLGRPAGTGFEEKFSLRPVAKRLSELLARPVELAPDCVGDSVAGMAAALQPGDVLMLENTRFHKAETFVAKHDPLTQDELASAAEQRALAQQMASLADIYVNDAFGTAHRAHASTAVIAEFATTSVAGFLMEKELKFLGELLRSPERPFVAVIGGAKVSGKLEVLRNLIGRVDTILIGGGMAYTFFKAQGREVGESLVEDDLLETSLTVLALAKEKGTEVVLPVDNVIADRFAADAATQIASGDYPESWMGMDIGPETIDRFSTILKNAKTVLWNGPMGCFEMAPFATGTNAICEVLADSDAVSVIGGGDSASAAKQSGRAADMSHISTGGGASLEFLEGRGLPGVEALDLK